MPASPPTSSPASSLSPDTLLRLPRSPHRFGRSLLALWHLLSLDAPSVATVWTLYVASAAHLYVPRRVPVAMFAAVWVLYAADRLLDSRILATTQWNSRLAKHPQPGFEAPGLEARHFFHHQHRRQLIGGIIVCALILAAVVPQRDPAAIRLDLVLGSLLFAYFILIHATGSAHRLPKEISVGLFFAAAVFIPTVARVPQLRLTLLPIAMLFAALCSLNCLFIYRWEHAPMRTLARLPAGIPQPHWLTRTALHSLPAITVCLAGAALALAAATQQTASLPIALAAVLLLGLHHLRGHLAPLTLRAAADLVLLTPLPLLVFRHTR